MIIRKAYKFRLKPSAQQVVAMEQLSGCCRFVWNKVLRLCLDRLSNKQYILWYQESAYWLRLWKHSEDYGFLQDCHSQVLQQKLKDLDRAFRDGFDKKQPLKRLPRFRKKWQNDSFRYPQGFKVDNRRVYLPKIGWIGFHKSQAIHGNAKNLTILREGKHWYCSIQVEMEVPGPIPTRISAIGMDMGIVQFAAMSNDEYISPIHAFKLLQSTLGKAQRKLSKKTKFSNNWKKQKQRIQKIHSRIRHVRHDFLHKSSTQLSKNHAMIVVEDLKIINMSKSAKGCIETPGRNVKAKSGLNKSILDQGWGEFRRQLEYKMGWTVGVLLKVNPKYTSQKCSGCGYTDKGNRKDQSRFECQQCGFSANADINAAKNILAAGYAVLACGEEALASSVKQEPLRNRERVAA